VVLAVVVSLISFGGSTVWATAAMEARFEQARADLAVRDAYRDKERALNTVGSLSESPPTIRT
jgi:hypothetical protein